VCNRHTHRAGGVLFGSLYAHQLPLVVGAGSVTAVLSIVGVGIYTSITAAGRFSPDMDQYGWWRRMREKVSWLEKLPGPNPLWHRRLTHWWGFPALLTWGLLHLVSQVGWSTQEGGTLLFVLGAPLLGWWNHLIYDFVVGARYSGWHGPARARPKDMDPHKRGAGIPLAPWGWNVGLGHKNGSLVERGLLVISLLGILANIVVTWNTYSGVA
jgi:hypothetical protein